MSLFGDLPQARNDSDSGGASTWSSVQATPSFKPQALFGPPPSVLRAGKGRGSDAQLQRNGSKPPPSSSAVTDSAIPTSAVQPTAATSIFTAAGPIEDEYDPARPNDYEQVRKERERKRREAEEEAERQARLRELDQQQQAEPDEARGLDEHSGLGRDQFLNVSGDEAFMRRAQLSGGAAPAMPGTAAKGMAFAERMLKKMGWKEGEGLGKNRQGISTPLVAQKTAQRAGVIVNATPTNPMDGGPMGKRARTGATITGAPTKIALLKNMVPPGGVDSDLEDEIAEELSKYGKVVRVLIFEVTEPGFPVDEAVRIFVQFDRVEAATKAVVELQGRFFGGRTVKTDFYDEGRFNREDLAPDP